MKKSYQQLKKTKLWRFFGKFTNFLSVVLLIILIPILAVNLLFIYQREVEKEKIPNVLSYAPLIVRTDSMHGKHKDSFDKGDVIITKILAKKDRSKLKVGDVVTFLDKTTVVSHRIAKIDSENRIYTQGDMNNSLDQGFLTAKDVRAVYQSKVKRLGYKLLWLHSPAGTFICVILPLFIIMIFFSNRTKKEEPESEDDEVANEENEANESVE
ncbi:MAG: signal peptidase I [Streptococcaceae bacterium]|jgi:signal peptidase I|nr:signal peptidase I [Streptococcaceae bacterium]